jgi:flagellar hook-length control protein FliK
MQFFPSVDAGTGQLALANPRFESADMASGRDFSGFLSEQMNRPEPVPAASKTAETASAPEPEPVVSDVRSPNAADEEKTHRNTPYAENRATDSHREEPAGKDGMEAVQDGGSAKAADSETARPQKKADGEAVPKDTAEDSEPVSGAEGVGAARGAEEALGVNLQEALAQVTREARGRAAVNPEVEARIEALHGLLRQFRQSAPAERKELATALGAQIAELRKELAATKTAGEIAGTKAGKGAAAVKGKSGQAKSTDVIPAGSAKLVGAESGKDAAVLPQRAGKAEKGSEAPAQTPVAEGKGAAMNAQELRAGVKAEKATGSPQDTGGETNPKAEAGHVSAARQDAVPAQPKAEGKRAGTMPSDAARSGKTEAGVRQESAQAQGTAVSENKDAEGREAERVSLKHDAKSGKEAAHMSAAEAPSREAAKGSALSAGLAGRSEIANNKGEAQPQPASDAQDVGVRQRVPADSSDGKSQQNSRDSRDGFFGTRGENKSAAARSADSASGKIVLETEPQAQGAGQNPQSPVQQRLESPVSARSAEVYRQVENGAFKNLGQGVKQLVIRLDPAELGQVSVILQVKGKEVQAVLRASSQEATHALGEQLAQLRTQLESQGLKVGKLEVQTQLADSQGQPQWQGAEQHNHYQENRELALSAQRWRTLERVDTGLVRDVQNAPQREKLSSGGLDLFA